MTNSKRILFITAHQLSTEAKQLLRAGLKGSEFLEEIAGKGYTEGSKQLDHVADVEILMAKAYLNRKPYIFLQWGKDRRPGIVTDDKKSFHIPFPKNAPIPHDITGLMNGSINTDTDDGIGDLDI